MFLLEFLPEIIKENLLGVHLQNPPGVPLKTHDGDSPFIRHLQYSPQTFPNLDESKKGYPTEEHFSLILNSSVGGSR